MAATFILLMTGHIRVKSSGRTAILIFMKICQLDTDTGTSRHHKPIAPYEIRITGWKYLK